MMSPFTSAAKFSSKCSDCKDSLQKSSKSSSSSKLFTKNRPDERLNSPTLLSDSVDDEVIGSIESSLANSNCDISNVFSTIDDHHPTAQTIITCQTSLQLLATAAPVVLDGVHLSKMSPQKRCHRIPCTASTTRLPYLCTSTILKWTTFLLLVVFLCGHSAVATKTDQEPSSFHYPTSTSTTTNYTTSSLQPPPLQSSSSSSSALSSGAQWTISSAEIETKGVHKERVRRSLWSRSGGGSSNSMLSPLAALRQQFQQRQKQQTSNVQSSRANFQHNRLTAFLRNRFLRLGGGLKSRAEKKLQVQKQFNVTETPTVVNESKNSTNSTESGAEIDRRSDDPSAGVNSADWLNRIDSEMTSSTEEGGGKVDDVANAKTEAEAALSPTLNVIDLEPDRTKIKHSILVVRNKNGTLGSSSSPLRHLPPTPAPVIISSELKTKLGGRDSSSSTSVPVTTLITSTTSVPNSSSTKHQSLEDEAVPIKNNHRPSVFLSLAEWRKRNRSTSTTSTTTSTTTTSTPSSPPSSPPTSTLRSTTVAKELTIIGGDLQQASTYWPSSYSPSFLSTSNGQTWPPKRRTSTTPVIIRSKPTTTTTTSTTTTTTTTQPPPTTPPTTHQTSSTVKLTTRASETAGVHVFPGSSQAIDQEDFWTSPSATTTTQSTESYYPRLPHTTAALVDPSAITEFDLPVTRRTPLASNPSHETTAVWGETSYLIDETNPTPTTPKPTQLTSLEDDNSIELLKQYQESTSKTSLQSQTNTNNNKQTNLYVASGSSSSSSSSKPSDDGIVIFKNNHGRPRPRPGSRPTLASFTSTTTSSSKHLITAKPPYVTDFSVYPTTSHPYHQKHHSHHHHRPQSSYPQTQTFYPPPTLAAITIGNIAAHRLKTPETVQSVGITVHDPPFVPNGLMTLPLNTTIVHKNLLVPMKEGRPRPKYPSYPTTLFPVHAPIVFGSSVNKGHGHNNTSYVKYPPPSSTTPFSMPLMTTSAPDTMLMSMTTIDDFKISTTVTPSPPTKQTTIIKDIIITSGSSNNGPTSFDHLHRPHNHHHSHNHTPTIIKVPSTTATPSSSTTTTRRPVIISTSHRPASYPVASPSGGYVNAIYSPPMPVIRPSHSIGTDYENDLLGGNNGATWMTRQIRRLISSIAPADPQVSFFSALRTVLYNLMVMLLPPIALLSTLSFL